jgi:hypothetical protein
VRESSYYPPPSFVKDEEVYQFSTGDVYFVKSVERTVSGRGYAYNLVHCENENNELKTFREWEINSNAPRTE